MSETEFPLLFLHSELTNDDGKDLEILDLQEVMDWFERAIADFPKEPDFWTKMAIGVDSYLVYAGKVEAWKEKWLSQFYID